MLNPPHPAAPITFPCGVTMKNRFMLAPMTNCQSHEDGQLSEDEFHWLTKRAEGGFGLTMTCASHVQEIGQGFPGQLGIFSDDLLDGHRRLAAAIQEHGSLAVVQLHHAGMRSPRKLIGEAPVCPSEDTETGARALRLNEIHELRDAFIDAAVRCGQAGYDGVEIHGAHGYVLCQFLSPVHNRRQDAYGGSLENRMRLILEILRGVREQCGPRFLLGLRLSPERLGMDVAESMTMSQVFIDTGLLDFLDLSLWDCFKPPEAGPHGPKSLLQHAVGLDRKTVRLTVAGKISTAQNVRTILESGIDFVTIGRAAILHHDFPKRVLGDEQFEPVPLPVSADYLRQEGLGEAFIQYMGRWNNFVAK